jgi:hypothetical protein
VTRRRLYEHPAITPLLPTCLFVLAGSRSSQHAYLDSNVLCCAVNCVVQGVPAIALSLADHKATQTQHYAAPSEVAVTLIEVCSWLFWVKWQRANVNVPHCAVPCCGSCMLALCQSRGNSLACWGAHAAVTVHMRCMLPCIQGLANHPHVVMVGCEMQLLLASRWH